MEYNVLDNGWYQIPFTKTDGVNTLSDALVITPEDYATLTQDTFDAIAQQRFDNWIAVITTSSEEIV